MNRWEDPGKRGHARVGYERRFEAVQAFLAGEEPDGRWF